jgi:DNA-binding CsgD family transcriptional regulator
MTPERAALSLAGDMYGLLEIDEYRNGLLSALREVVPCDWTSLNEVGPDPERMVSIVEPPLDEHWYEAWAAHGRQNPLVQHIEKTLDGRPLRFSDVVTPAELHATDLYRELYGPIGLEYQIAFTLPASSGMILGVALSRRERDFSDTERDVLEIARPHLIQAYNNAMRHSRALAAADAGTAAIAEPEIAEMIALGLTAREAEILRLASAGRSDREIAGTLEISHRTVQKHLQRCYAKLGVRDRSQAAARLEQRRAMPYAGAASRVRR